MLILYKASNIKNPTGFKSGEKDSFDKSVANHLNINKV